MNFCMACGAPVEFSGEKFCNKCRFANDKQYQRDVRRRFGERLKAAREAAGLSRKELGDAVNLLPNSYGLYETGKRDASTATLIRLARFLKVSADWLIGLE